MGEKGEAFLKGGCGCSVAFLAIGFFFVLIGGSMHIDIGGAIMLFVLGGIIGLVILAVYNRGARDAGTSNVRTKHGPPRDTPDSPTSTTNSQSHRTAISGKPSHARLMNLVGQ